MIVELKIKVKPKASDKKLLKQYESKLYKKLNRQFQNVYGKSVTLNQVRKTGGKVGYNQTGGKNPSSPYASEIQALYKEAWRARYQEIQESYQSTFTPEKLAKHQYRKRLLKSKGKITAYGKRVQYTSPALLSGYFRQSLTYGFDVGGSSKVKLGHLLLHSSYGIDIEDFKGNYVKTFIELVLMKKGVISSPEDMFTFNSAHQTKIAKFMRYVLEKDLMPRWTRILKSSASKE